MKFCPVVPEICRGQVHVARKERKEENNYDLHEKLISIIIKLRKGYFPEVQTNMREITSYWFDVLREITTFIAYLVQIKAFLYDQYDRK
jgi:hypothetical protein